MDTTQFLNLLNNTKITAKPAMVCTIDVKDLYTSIRHDEGIECCREYLSKEKLPGHEVNFLCECLDYILKRNYFRFNSDFYLQIQGTSMGANMAPAYANIYMHLFEHMYVLNHPVYTKYIAVWRRYVDDMFMVWTGTEELLQEFFGYLNSVHDTIQFTMNIGPQTVNYLDVQVTLTENGFITDLYKKPTDRNNLLRRDSFHPVGVTKGLPKSQFIRARRITATDELYNNQAEELIEKFCARGYERRELQKISRDILKTERKDLLKEKSKSIKKQNLVCVTTYGPHSALIRKVILQHWPILQNDKTFGRLFVDKPMFCYKKGKHISNGITRTDFRGKQTHTAKYNKIGTFPCYNCGHCNGVIRGEICKHPSQGYDIKLRHFATCETESVIYLLKCPCGFGYVGQTSRAVRIRLNEHKSVIRNYKPETKEESKIAHQKDKEKEKYKKETLLAKHYFEQGHNVAQLRWQILEVVRNDAGNDKTSLLRRESFWIWKLKTLWPKGLNENFSLTCYL
ncbi:uncharacterized protein LOC121396962 [Xenopus laevis]|uniref:Uncharacterized protein LOC121396962 n=1 Tax=Xenopus laevis TaxID=8355 RepID=A0A8J1LGR1_XENLA|nr:uncharacterized protein LOC121396962 [Xenopus laevis]XP_041428560.1 uncharacterized protein LOC121396962 [Xenopus laevis]XP_041428561.1 uncharacterized protein LOC121396962 [Xenopus laevis]XP_041428562.1 uncharacterized protein LOC121396962 [Xenopus laevis]XP_041428563.1 uncharacterized protein LOC121396962 [Xenopus laevis]